MDKIILEKLGRHFASYPTKSFAKGGVLTQAGQTPDGIYLLMEGVVEQYDITPEGNKMTVNVFKPQAFFPMSWAINKKPNAYFYVAHTDVKVKIADADATVEFLKSNPDVMFNLLSRVYKGTDHLLNRLVLATSGLAESRLIFELLIEAYRFGTEQPDGRWLTDVKQQTLAARSGLARETVSRELHKLENEHMISLSKEGIIIDTQQLGKKLNVTI